jgi:hypothetical protein
MSGFQEAYARKFNSLVITSDPQICPDKTDSLKKKVFCVVFCRSMIVLFLLVIVLPALVLQWGSSSQTFEAKSSNFTWLDHIQWEKACV